MELGPREEFNSVIECVGISFNADRVIGPRLARRGHVSARRDPSCQRRHS